MRIASFFRPVAALLLSAFLQACALDRADDAAAAKTKMVGMTREEVLACMGAPKKKASEGATEVWSYLSTNGRGDSNSDMLYTTSYVHSNGEHDRSFCTVNVVMKNGIVTVIHYNGPTSSYLFSQDDQCGFAVANCVGH